MTGFDRLNHRGASSTEGLPKDTRLRVGVRAQNAMSWGYQAFTPNVTTER